MSKANGMVRADRAASTLDESGSDHAANSANFARPPQPQSFTRANPSAKSMRALIQPGDESLEWDALASLPQPTKTMFYGVLGRLAREAAEGTEVNAAAAMLASMSWASAAVGCNHVVRVGNGWHRPNLFTLHVGRSNKGGKGMALELLARVMEAMTELPHGSRLAPGRHSGGLSSTEGLICLVHDGYRDGKTEHAAIEDKRLWVVESEFANVLKQARRDGNTLSPTLRNTWDGQTLAPAVKHSRVWATNPHIALHGSITPGEVLRCMSANDLGNGFANRFLMIFAERTDIVAFPRTTPQATVNAFAEELAAVIEPALAGYPDIKVRIELSLSPAAAGLYADLYRQMAQAHPAGELVSGLLQRRAPMLLRIALLFALLDGERAEVKRPHVEAAAAWMDYFAQSVAFVFGRIAGAEDETRTAANAERLHAWLAATGDWRPRKEITTRCFGGHLLKPAIDAAIERLTIEDRIERREVATGAPTKRTDYRVKFTQAAALTTSMASLRKSSPAGSQAGMPVAAEGSHRSQCSRTEASTSDGSSPVAAPQTPDLTAPSYAFGMES